MQNMRPWIVSLLLYRKLTWMLYSTFCYTNFYPSSICLPNHLASLVASHEEVCHRPFRTGVTLYQAAFLTCYNTDRGMMNHKRLRHSFLLLESVYQIQMVRHMMDVTMLLIPWTFWDVTYALKGQHSLGLSPLEQYLSQVRACLLPAA